MNINTWNSIKIDLVSVISQYHYLWLNKEQWQLKFYKKNPLHYEFNTVKLCCQATWWNNTNINICMITHYLSRYPNNVGVSAGVSLAQPTVKGAISAQHVIHQRGRLQPEDQHITQANTCAINPLLSEFKMEKRSTSEEENALKGT